jgi:putative spermidine/putrescine transport system permease protein
MTNKNSIFRVIMALVAVCILIPIILMTAWAFTSRWQWPDLLGESLSLRGFEEVFINNVQGFRILVSSVFISMEAAFFATVIGYMSAQAFVMYDFPFKKWLHFGSMLPIIIPSSVFAMGIHVYFIKWGINDSIIGVLIGHVLYCLPYTVNILGDSREALGNRYEQQAMMLGCDGVTAFFHITLPLMLPSVISAFSMAYIISFSQYFITMLLGGGVVKTYAVLVFPLISAGDRTIAGAYTLVFLLSSMMIFILFEGVIKFIVKKIVGTET